MISFIIIGRNEGWKLTKCFKSVFKTIEENNLTDAEVIYVDSKSTDDSITRAKRFPQVRVFQITGHCNAAIGRNIGANESKGDILFFIDGDMEIIPKFIPLVYEEKSGLKYNFVSGQFENHYYDIRGNFLYKENFHSSKRDQFQATTGGLFLIKQKLWDSVNGMKTKYKRSQDLDLGFRLSKIGIKLLRKKELLAKHHTVSYRDGKRMWQMLFSNANLYAAVLLRDHISNSRYLKEFLRQNYTSVILIICLFIALSTKTFIIFGLYLFSVTIRAILNMKNEILLIPSRIIYFILRDTSLLLGLLIFWPTNKIQYKYIERKD